MTSEQLAIVAAAGKRTSDVLADQNTSVQGLSAAEAMRRVARDGPNVIRVSRGNAWKVLARQFHSPLLLLLAIAATVSFFVGERTDAIIIGLILAVSVGLGFVNEYRAEQAAAALRDQMRRRAVVVRDNKPTAVDVAELVVGDIVHLSLGSVVGADLRLVDVTHLECDESVLTGEALPVEKQTQPVRAGSLDELTNCALMGTVVRAGSGVGVVVATGERTEFGRIAAELAEASPQTEFQEGLARFSRLLLGVAGVLVVAIVASNLLLHRPAIAAILFALAIAVGITPQLLPAIVSTSLAAGSRQLARQRVLVKHLVTIEDLGDIDTLVTDKTGTLTEGAISFQRALDPMGNNDTSLLTWGLVCNDAELVDGRPVAGNALDVALWAAAEESDRAGAAAWKRLAEVPFDHDRRIASVLVSRNQDRCLVAKGAPEAIIQRCSVVAPETNKTLTGLYAEGSRVIAVATRPMSGNTATPNDERDLTLLGFYVFSDPPKRSAQQALHRLADLGITVVLATGDSVEVAQSVCTSLGLTVSQAFSGEQLHDPAQLRLPDSDTDVTVLARISPEDKANVVRSLRQAGRSVAFLGDGVNDAIALHEASVGISVDTATDVAKDAADIILLDKDLGVLADGVVGGRRIFANTIKYVLMGTSSNFGNMFSAAGASAFLKFLPMLPSQILLNNLLYDASQLAIPTDSVDDEQLHRPSHWDVGFIRRFMLFFGPISSLFDFLTFAIMLRVFHAGPALFRSGWFVESLATQSLVVFAIRTRRVPFFRSRPSMPLLLTAIGAAVTGMVLPYLPFAHTLGFRTLPLTFFGVLIGLVAAYLLLIELGKHWFYAPVRSIKTRRSHADRRTARRARQFHGTA